MELNKRILVVEDDEGSILCCQILLKTAPMPQSAYSGTEAMLYIDAMTGI